MPVVYEDDTNELHDRSKSCMRSIVEIREHTVIPRDHVSVGGPHLNSNWTSLNRVKLSP